MMLRTSLSVLAAAAAGFTVATPFTEIPGYRTFSGEVLARPLQDSNRADALRHISKNTRDVIEGLDIHVLRVPAGMNENSYINSLMATGDFEYVEPNWTVYTQFTPNDPQFGSQYAHTLLQSTLAWDVTFGSTNVIIAICDTGVRTTHQDLAARMVPGYNSITQLPQIAGGVVTDIQGHGTHCAGDAAAIGNNGVGVSGPAGNVSIMPVRVANSGSSTMDNILRGARWAGDNGARVVSVSWSGWESASVGTAGTYLRARNSLLFFAAGNDNRNLTSVDHADVTVVGATDSADAKASFSAFGNGTDIYAPGVNILSTTWTSDTSYGNASGTSMATPVAAGVAALIMSANPSLSAGDVETILEHGSQDLASDGPDTYWGWGRVNANRSVRLAIQGKLAYNPATMRFYERVGANLNGTYARNHASWRTLFGLSGSLASISTAAEHSFLTTAYTGNDLVGLHIGGQQAIGAASTTAGWSWDDGSAWGYTNWAPGQPNDANATDERALFILDNLGRWGDTTFVRTDIINGFLMEYQSTPVTIAGVVNLSDVSTVNEPIEFRLFWNGMMIQSGTTTNGAVNISTGLRGPVQLWVKASHWLARRVSFNLDGGGFSGMNINLQNGDCNGDNEVGAADFSVISAAYDSVTGDGTFNPNADLNNDGEVGAADFSILAANYDAEGDQ